MDHDSCVCEAPDSGWTNSRFDGKPVAARSRVRSVLAFLFVARNRLMSFRSLLDSRLFETLHRFDTGTPLPCSRRSSNKTGRLGVRSGRRSSPAFVHLTLFSPSFSGNDVLKRY